MVIAIDFDGTVVTHDYPEIGRSTGAEPMLRWFVENGHKLILYTMRSHKPTEDGRDLLQEAVDWFKERDIELYGVNENPDQKSWTDSPKPIADWYIDDRALGCPLALDPVGKRPCVFWGDIAKMFNADVYEHIHTQVH